MTEWVLVPREPVDAQLTSMALTYDHGYGLRNAFERENIRLHMAQLHRAMLDAAPAAPQMTDAEMIRTEAWQSITDELAHAAYLRGIDEGKRQAAAPQQAEPVAQIGWADEFGNLFPMGAWKPTQRTHHDSHKTAWRPVYLHPPAEPQQAEPVAWMAFGGALVHAVTRNAMDPIEAERFDVPLYLHPPAAPQQADPVAWVRNLTDAHPHCVTGLQFRSAADVDAGVLYTPLYATPPSDELARLRAENERLKADAARYEWLKSNATDFDLTGGNDNQVRIWTTRRSYDAVSIDAAIDAAMAQGGKHGPG